MGSVVESLRSPRIPLELLLAVKDLISPFDLRTHVCYANTCRAVAALYGDTKKQELFWKNTCLLVGIGHIPEDETTHMSWKTIAFECIAKDGFCTHPGCGDALLAKNALRMDECTKMRPYWSPQSGPVDDGFTYDDINLNALNPQWNQPIFRDNTVLYNIKFNRDKGCVLHNLRLMLQDNDSVLQPMTANTENHPILYRSFAIFPPISRICISDIAGHLFPVRNPSGLTVWDIIFQLDNSLDVEISIHDLLVYLENITDRSFEPMKLEEFATVRRVWSKLTWNNLEYSGILTQSGMLMHLDLIEPWEIDIEADSDPF